MCILAIFSSGEQQDGIVSTICSLAVHPYPSQHATITTGRRRMATEGDRDDTSLLSLSRETSTSGSRPKSRPCSPNRNHRLPTQDEVGTALQSTIEDLANLDLDTSVVVHLSNCPGALRKIKDLLPIHFYSWKLKNAEAALIYTLLHMFVLLGQYREMEGERVTYQDYVTQLKSRIAQLEDERMFEQQQEQSSGDNERHREELVRLRRENAALRQSNTKLQASQDQVRVCVLKVSAV